MLHDFLERSVDDALRSNLKTAMSARFGDRKMNSMMLVAALDPSVLLSEADALACRVRLLPHVTPSQPVLPAAHPSTARPSAAPITAKRDWVDEVNEQATEAAVAETAEAGAVALLPAAAPRVTTESVLDSFFAARAFGAGGSTLEWWKNHAKEFPGLWDLAMRSLSLPPSTTSCERLFSTAGWIITKRRSRLAPELVEALVVLKKDWGVMADDDDEVDDKDNDVDEAK